MKVTSPMNATLPYLGGTEERRALSAGTRFLDLASGPQASVEALGRWFDECVVSPGFSARLSVLLEPAAGSIVLGGAQTTAPELTRVISTARSRVVAALRGYIGTPPDDRFLRAAIFLGRVRRQDSQWVPRPEPTAPLSGIVLSLFASAILSERSFYDNNLCVCDTCGRVSFDAAPARRRTCANHTTGVSGVHHVVTPPASPRRR